ncbi:putative fibroin heavy chain [Iris pallida]|uniref:Fibroin heavy chain n=1 Tax=Iris pallida TaxID=29817 RepID=A0AAX6IC38_IRIPA|nr:putative fibroin heavy chain [Iris pallida]
MASSGENYGYSGKNNTTGVSGWSSNGNSIGNINNTAVGNGNNVSAQPEQKQQLSPIPSPRSEVQPYNGVNNTGNISSSTGIENCNKISAQSTQEQQSAPVPSPRSGVQPSSERNYGYSASGRNKISVSGRSKENSAGSTKNNTTEVSGWSNGSSVGSISKIGAENDNRISAQSAQEQQSAPVPFPASGVQPSGVGNYGYSPSGNNKMSVSGRSKENSAENIGNFVNPGVGNRNKISAQSSREQHSAPVPSLWIGVQASRGGNYRYSASDNNDRNSNTGVGDCNKTLAQSPQEQQSAPVPSPWSGVEPSGGGNYGYRANHDNNMSVSGWSNGNSVGNIRNTGVGTNNSESTPRRSCCSCLICS